MTFHPVRPWTHHSLVIQSFLHHFKHHHDSPHHQLKIQLNFSALQLDALVVNQDLKYLSADRYQNYRHITINSKTLAVKRKSWQDKIEDDPVPPDEMTTSSWTQSGELSHLANHPDQVSHAATHSLVFILLENPPFPSTISHFAPAPVPVQHATADLLQSAIPPVEHPMNSSPVLVPQSVLPSTTTVQHVQSWIPFQNLTKRWSTTSVQTAHSAKTITIMTSSTLSITDHNSIVYPEVTLEKIFDLQIFTSAWIQILQPGFHAHKAVHMIRAQYGGSVVRH